MIRKMNVTDHDRLFHYLNADPSMNLFIIGDIEDFGYQADFQDIWANVNEARAVTSVLLRYFHSYVMNGETPLQPEYFDILHRDPHLELLQGPAMAVDPFVIASKLIFSEHRMLYFAELAEATPQDCADPGRVKVATVEDVDRILELRSTIEEFSIRKNARESLSKGITGGSARALYIEDGGGRMVAVASTTAENSLSAMVVGVCTRADRRKEGLAALCMTRLCRDLVSEGKRLCLFYDNPQAGQIYKRLGFHDKPAASSVTRWAVSVEPWTCGRPHGAVCDPLKRPGADARFLRARFADALPVLQTDVHAQVLGVGQCVHVPSILDVQPCVTVPPGVVRLH